MMQKADSAALQSLLRQSFQQLRPGPFSRNAGGDLPAKFQGGLEGLGVFLLNRY